MTGNQPKILTFADYARHRGVTQQAVSYAVKHGRLVESLVKGEDGRIRLNLEVADREWGCNTDTSQQGKGAAKGKRAVSDTDFDQPISFSKSRAVREKYQAEIARLKYEELAGNLIDAHAVRSKAFAIGRAFREAIAAIPDRIASQLAGETDPHKVHKVISTELNKALEVLSDGL